MIGGRPWRFVAAFAALALWVPVALGLEQAVFTEAERDFIRQHPVIVVGGESDWPPFDFVQEDGTYAGAAKDYLDLLSAATGLQFEVRTGPAWNELLQQMRSKRIDLLPMLYWSQERTGYMHFTKPYLTVRHYVFARQGDRVIRSMDDLEDKTVAIPKGYAQVELLRRRYPGVDVLEVDDPLAAIDAVITHKADAFIENTALVGYRVKQNSIRGLMPAFASDLGVNRLYMAVREDWPLLRDIVQKGLDAIPNHEKDRVAARWMQMQPAGPAAAVAPRRLSLSQAEQRYLRRKNQVRACVDPNWMPLERLEDGVYRGIGADYLQLFESRIGIRIDVVETDSWAQSVAFAKQRRCDLFVLSMDTSARRQYMDITTPFLKVPLVIATRPDVVFVTELDELKGKRIGIVEGYAVADKVKQVAPDIEFVYVPSNRAGLRQVADGTLFGFLDTVSAIADAIQRDFYGELKIGGRLGIDWELGVATRNDEPLLGRIFERAVQTVSDDEQREIMNRWVAVKYEQGLDYRMLWQIVIGFSLALLFFMYRNRQLEQHRRNIYQKNVQLAEVNNRLAEQKERVQYLAEHDALTGLPNRSRFIERLQHAITVARRQGQQLAVLFIDLDRFKNINDSLGHQVGDQMLTLISRKLEGVLRDADTVARCGGDEFLVLMEAIDGLDDPAFVAEKLQAVIKEPIRIRDYQLNNSASIGIALFPQDGDDAGTLIKNADSAMYLAKDEGKDNYQYYTKSLSAQIRRRLVIEHALGSAIEQDQFSLLYQPQVDLASGQIKGVEALLRWTHPELGAVSPSEFIPIAEDAGQIGIIGEWVFRQACKQFEQWRNAGCLIDTLAINVSSVQFDLGDLANSLADIVGDLTIEPSQVELEITEGYIMKQTEQNQRVLEQLRRIGFRISVDDFGTGYSSMSYLKTLPLDTIKIDKSFIDDIHRDGDNGQIAKAILALSHSLGYAVVAEGIERHDQWQQLQAWGCELGQGYLFSKPLSAASLPDYVAERGRVGSKAGLNRPEPAET